MKPFIHARKSARRHGGKPEDYLFVHDFIDSSKITMSEPQHRAILHSTFGTYLAEKCLGTTFINSEGKEVSVRQIAEEHVFDDLGRVPTTQDWLKNLPLEPWMIGRIYETRKRKEIKLF